MGGKSSKDAFDRNTPIRQSQKKRFAVIKRRCDSIGKRLKKIKDKPGNEEVYDALEKEILGVQNVLQEISPDLKEKFKKAFDEYVSKCDTFLNELNSHRPSKELNTEEVALVLPQEFEIPNRPPSEVPKTPVSEVSFSLDEPLSSSTIERRKKKVRKSKQDVYHRRVSMEEKSFHAIDKIRVEMSVLRDEVLVFKGSRNDQVFHFLKESFLRFITKLEDVEIYDNRQIKYERRVAVAFARDSITALEELADGSDLDKVRRSLIVHDQLSQIQFVSQDNLLESPKVEEVSKQISSGRSSSDGSPEKEINMRDFKKLLDVKLGRMSKMNSMTISMIKKGKEFDECQVTERGTNIDESDGESSGDDIDNILHNLSVSTECLTPTFKVTSI